MKKKVAIIGAGVAGIASAVRLACKGYCVEVFEKNSEAGGKIGQIQHDGFRFDTGPSLFTMPHFIEELFEIAHKNIEDYFYYDQLKASCKYYWEDGTSLNAYQDKDEFYKEVKKALGVSKASISKYLKQNKKLYDLAEEVFIINSFHKFSNYGKKSHLKMFVNLWRLNAFTSMHKKNKQTFKNEKLTQLFDRYATYNGSNPYKTPATLNMISHLEHNIGAFFPSKGIYNIVDSLIQLASSKGVKFHFNQEVQQIVLQNKRATGLQVDGKFLEYDKIVSDADIIHCYKNLLPNIKIPKTQLKQERSTSALIFYWGIKKQFPELELHNILFSDNYKEEFEHLFKHKTISSDPTVYIFISSKHIRTDAPEGCENWFVMINVPENIGQNWDEMIRKAKEVIISKINRVLKTNIENFILFQKQADPRTIEKTTSSYRGSLYGLSSNGMFSAFLRHPNFKRKFRNLYFTGGSVHPGGGIPLCLASAKIVAKEFESLE